VDVFSVQDVRELNGYDAYIVGTPIHGGNWLPEIATFLRKSTKRLAGKPVYLWVSCIRVMEAYGFQHVMDYYMHPEVLRKLNLRDTTAFAGKLDLNHVDWGERWTLSARYDGSTWPINFDGDFRDWGKIDAWAQHIVQDLKTLASATSCVQNS
jgi:menaquinone-dependent protoporphyrinogen oxidase